MNATFWRYLSCFLSLHLPWFPLTHYTVLMFLEVARLVYIFKGSCMLANVYVCLSEMFACVSFMLVCSVTVSKEQCKENKEEIRKWKPISNKPLHLWNKRGRIWIYQHKWTGEWQYTTRSSLKRNFLTGCWIDQLVWCAGVHSILATYT